ENSALLHVDITHNADAPGFIGKLYVITPRIYVGYSQAFIVIDGPVPIVLALIDSPILLARRRHLKCSNGVDRQIPEANRLVLDLRSGIHKNKGNSYGYQSAHVVPPTGSGHGRGRLLFQEAVAIYSLVEVVGGFETDRSCQSRGSKIGPKKISAGYGCAGE